MLSSNSGFKRLSRAALSRSQFLKLAAGALLPLAGLRLSAAAANGDTAEPKQAVAPARMGSILVNQFGPVKIHSYLSPTDGFHVNTQMIEGKTAVVIFHGELLLPYADEVSSSVPALGKPLARILPSLAHTSSWPPLHVSTDPFPSPLV